MKTKILIPTDFTVESLNTLKLVLGNSNENDSFDVVLVHGTHLEDSITEMLFFSKGKILRKLVNREFHNACEMLRAMKQVNSIRTDIFTGFKQKAFDYFIEGHGIDSAAIPTNYQFKNAGRYSFDMLAFIRKSALKITEVSWYSESALSRENNKAEIFMGMQTT